MLVIQGIIQYDLIIAYSLCNFNGKKPLSCTDDNNVL